MFARIYVKTNLATALEGLAEELARKAANMQADILLAQEESPGEAAEFILRNENRP